MFGVDDIVGIVNTAGKIIDKFIPDPAAALAAKQELAKMDSAELQALVTQDTNLAVAQIKVNEEQAKNSSLFVSGARPALLWMCGAAYAYTYILQPFMTFILVCLGISLKDKLPEIPMEPLAAVLMTLIGARTVERVKNVQRDK